MPPSAKRRRTICGPIDPGPEPDWEEMSAKLNFEETVEGRPESEEPQDTHQSNKETHQNSKQTLRSVGEIHQDPQEIHQDPINDIDRDRIIIAIDFGTTYSSVAYAVVESGRRPEDIGADKVRCIGRYPGYGLSCGQDWVNREEVPTELWYEDGRSIITEAYLSDDEVHVRKKRKTSKKKITRFQAKSAGSRRYWGYEAQHKINTIDDLNDKTRPLNWFKLNLVPRRATAEIQYDVRTRLAELKNDKFIENYNDVYRHYLEDLLSHARKQLDNSGEIQGDDLIEFVLCVPAQWPMEACRNMQRALEDAVKSIGMGNQAEESARDLFMISEPEAAAEWILAEAKSRVRLNETIVVIDAGGGTVDAVTYTCTNVHPLRLVAEVGAPRSRLCGASFINHKFEEHILKRLEGEDYLVTNGETLKSIAQAATLTFENGLKRSIDVTRATDEMTPIKIPNLRRNPAKMFKPNKLLLDSETIRGFFDESLKGVRRVLHAQLRTAENHEKVVGKIVLTGGFGQSPSLQSFLRAYLKDQEIKKGCQLRLIVPQTSSTAVARGAVIRALNKNNGPRRFTQCSYGFTYNEPFDPELEEHQKQYVVQEKEDGETYDYINNVIHWLIPAGQSVENMQTFTFEARQTIPAVERSLVCWEELWMSDQPHEGHFRATHSANRGAVKVCKITVDFTFLKDKKLIQAKKPPRRSPHPGKYWEIEYEVVMIIEGRSLKFMARWPVKEALKPGEKQYELGMKQISIAAAFTPGTK